MTDADSADVAPERKHFYDRPVVSNERALKSVPGIQRNAECFDSCPICTVARSGNLNCSERETKEAVEIKTRGMEINLRLDRPKE